MRPDEVAMQWLGTRWLLHGRSKAGLDCVGLVVVVARHLGSEVTDCLDYGRYTQDHRLLNRLLTISDRVVGALPGDIVVLAESRFPGHCGFLRPGGKVVHASTKRRRVTVDFTKDLGTMVGAYRLKGM